MSKTKVYNKLTKDDIEDIINNKQEKFHLLINSFKDLIFSIIKKNLKLEEHNTYEYEDIAQEIYIKIYEKIDLFVYQNDRSMMNFIYSIARNKTIDHYRSSKHYLDKTKVPNYDFIKNENEVDKNNYNELFLDNIIEQLQHYTKNKKVKEYIEKAVKQDVSMKDFCKERSINPDTMRSLFCYYKRHKKKNIQRILNQI